MEITLSREQVEKIQWEAILSIAKANGHRLIRPCKTCGVTFSTNEAFKYTCAPCLDKR